MTVYLADVLEAAGAGEEDTGLATAVLDEATTHVDNYITASLIDAAKPVPDALKDAAILTCAADLFAARKAPFGVQIMADANGTPVTTRLGADPLGRARPMLAGYCAPITFAYPLDTA